MLHKSIVLAAAFAAMAAAIPVELAPERLSECPENENYNGRECVCRATVASRGPARGDASSLPSSSGAAATKSRIHVAAASATVAST